MCKNEPMGNRGVSWGHGDVADGREAGRGAARVAVAEAAARGTAPRGVRAAAADDLEDVLAVAHLEARAAEHALGRPAVRAVRLRVARALPALVARRPVHRVRHLRHRHVRVPPPARPQRRHLRRVVPLAPPPAAAPALISAVLFLILVQTAVAVVVVFAAAVATAALTRDLGKLAEVDGARLHAARARLAGAAAGARAAAPGPLALGHVRVVGVRVSSGRERLARAQHPGVLGGRLLLPRVCVRGR